MKILITGGLGFQGSHLTESLLKQNHQVVILNTYSQIAQNNLNKMRKKPIVVWGSITDFELTQKTVRGQDVVFHLAAHINVDESIKYPDLVLKTNIEGSLNVMNACLKQHKRLILVSSCEVYGNPLHTNKINEEVELRPHSPYAASKAAVDRICFSYLKTYALKATILRPFNVFGERQKEDKFGSLIPILVKRAISGKNLQIHGTGKQTRDYIYIDDLIHAYNLVLNTKNIEGEIFNLGTGRETSIKEIAFYIAKKFNIDIEYVGERQGQVMRFCADITHAKNILGFEPKIDIWQGINRYILWRLNYENN